MPERLDLLALARECLTADGYLVICETPTADAVRPPHGADAVPARAAARHRRAVLLALATSRLRRRRRRGGRRRTPRPARRATRWGFGASFHELELVFEDLAVHTVASSYDPLLYPGRPVPREELHLASLLDAWRPDLRPCWSRTWLDTILSAQPPVERGEHVRPWQMALSHDVPGVAMLADGRLELRPGARLPVQLPTPPTACTSA